jgi:hypothetical protein
MTNILKGIMVAYGVILVLTGLAVVIAPEQISKIWNISDIVGYAKWFVAALGAVYVAAGVWLTAAGWNPVPQTHWVKFAITKTLLSLAVTVYAILKEFIGFNAVMGLVIGVDAVFAILFLAFYPWRSR